MDETNWAAMFYVSNKAKMVMKRGRRIQQQVRKRRWRPASGAEDGRVRGDLGKRHGRLIHWIDRSIDHYPASSAVAVALAAHLLD